METAVMSQPFEISVPLQYVSTIKNVVKAVGGKVGRKTVKRKSGLDKSLEDIRAGRVSKRFSSVDEMFADLMQ